MKRLLKSTGTIYVHLDWHASHYVKVEMDKIFGYDNFINEIVWCYSGGGSSVKDFGKKHDVILRYSKTSDYKFCGDDIRVPYNLDPSKRKSPKAWGSHHSDKIYSPNAKGKIPEDWWVISPINSMSKERIGYPTQKPFVLLERIIKASSKEGDVVADFCCGGGTTPTVAQKLNRRWIACDQSRVAVAITQGRLETLHERSQSEGTQQTLLPTPDISVEYWGTYEIPGLEALTDLEFRSFVVSAYGGQVATGGGSIHGFKKQTPLFVGKAKQKNRVTKKDVADFAREMVEAKGRYKGTMLAWSFAESAKLAVERFKGENHAEIDLVQITLTELDSSSFKNHILKLHNDYASFLTFILPPLVSVSHNKTTASTYEFDASESMALNVGAKIVNVQWDFDYKGRFTPTQGFAYGRAGSADKIKPLFKVEYKFPHLGNTPIACRVQDDLGGEKIYTEIIKVG